MGYDIHITRKENWFDTDGQTISLDEWVGYIAEDPDLRLDGGGSATLPDGSELAWENEGTAVWTAWPGHGTDRGMAWITHDAAGNIHVKSPDVETITKMHQIAMDLDARVQGDEGEFYGPSGEQVVEDVVPPTPPKKGLLSRLFGR